MTWRRGGPEFQGVPLSATDLGLANWSWQERGPAKAGGGASRDSNPGRDLGRVRFTTGTMRIEDDRRTITVPVIGPLRAKENRRAQRHQNRAGAQILNMTLSQRWGRLFVAVCYALRTPTTRSAHPADCARRNGPGSPTSATVANS